MEKTQVIKANGKKERFNEEKIKKSLTKSYNILGKTPNVTTISNIVDYVKTNITEYIEENVILSKVIGDLVEEALLEIGEIELARLFIKYRIKQHDIDENDNKFNINIIKRNGEKEKFNLKKIKKFYMRASEGLDNCSWKDIKKELKKYLIDNLPTNQIYKLLIKSSIDKITINNIAWQQIAGRIKIMELYKQSSLNSNFPINKLYSEEYLVYLVKDYVKRKLYFKDFFKFYKEDDFKTSARWIDKKRDFEYGFPTVLMFSKRYLNNPNGIIKELPQHMYLMASMFLAIPEGLDTFLDNITEEERKKIKQEHIDILKNPNKTLDDIIKLPNSILLHPFLIEKRLTFAKNLYEYTSTQKISLPTPTLLNARTNKHQLSSCFKLNIGDNLRGIYHGLEDMAQISKFGGGVGTYLGHIRAKGSSIRGTKGASGGVLPWIKLINDTAIAVNQLGARAGAISVTLDIWHLDILDFFEMQTETGDIRRKSFDVFPAISVPDLFMKKVINNEDWYLFDPKEIKDKYGFRIEDFYGKEFEEKYSMIVNDNKLELKEKVNAKELFKQFLKSVVETGMPYMFFRDTVNKHNPNKHKGMIYSSQLCTEIASNTKEPKFIEEKTEDGQIILKYEEGEQVVCNLASINVAKVNPKYNNVEQAHQITTRLLDNVITLNYYPTAEGKSTAMKYRFIGIGYMGLAEYLATQVKIRYDSEEAVKEVDKLFEIYAYNTLKSSVELAKERGKYKYFEGSSWSKGIVYGKTAEQLSTQTILKDKWGKLIDDIKKYGTRFGYHQAPAPNTSTAIVVGTTAGLLPVYKKYFVETNSAAPIVNVAPNLSDENFWLYKEYVNMNMKDVIPVISTIQKWIDQSISFEWIINPMNVSPKEMYEYYIQSWKQGLKTVYYVRSMSMEVEKCESCSG